MKAATTSGPADASKCEGIVTSWSVAFALAHICRSASWTADSRSGNLLGCRR
jgi:hypothetical protein